MQLNDKSAGAMGFDDDLEGQTVEHPKILDQTIKQGTQQELNAGSTQDFSNNTNNLNTDMTKKAPDKNTTNPVISDTPITPTAQPGASSQVYSSGQSPVMAGFLERLVAVFIDMVILFAGSLIISVILGISLGVMTAFSNNNVLNGKGLNPIQLLLQLFLSCLGFLYIGYFYTTSGATPGKKAFNLKVVDAQTLQNITWGKVFVRDVVGKLVSAIVLDLGYLWYFMSPKRQTWHDSIASTYVVKTDPAGNILMNGPEQYPSEPVKTFLPCGCCGLLFVAYIVAIILLISAAGKGYMNTVKNMDSKSNININNNGATPTLDPQSLDNLQYYNDLYDDGNK